MTTAIKPQMSDEQWENWQDWLSEGKTQAFLHALERRSKSLSSLWKDSLFSHPQDPSQGNFPELRAQARVYEQLANIGREQIEELLGHEPEAE
mgnify:CR=1 FL=1